MTKLIYQEKENKTGKALYTVRTFYQKNKQTKHIVDTLSEIPHFVADDNGNVRILTEMLINESYVESPDSKLMINAYMTQIMVEVARIAKGFDGNKGEKYHNTQCG